MWLVLPLFVLACGCGSSEEGPAKFHLSGKVTFEGQPVPQGTVLLIPTGDTKGPAGQARIVNGQYSTQEQGGTPVIAGDLLVQVEGFEADAPGQEFAKALFKPFETSHKMTNADGTLDIEVQAKH
jgi:hypothetical protein